MDVELEKLPRSVTQEVLSIIGELLDKGWRVSFARYDAMAFGNWYVDLDRLEVEIRIVKDRSQYFVTGPSANELQKAGLGRSFDDGEEFRRILMAWASAPPLA